MELCRAFSGEASSIRQWDWQQRCRQAATGQCLAAQQKHPCGCAPAGCRGSIPGCPLLLQQQVCRITWLFSAAGHGWNVTESQKGSILYHKNMHGILSPPLFASMQSMSSSSIWPHGRWTLGQHDASQSAFGVTGMPRSLQGLKSLSSCQRRVSWALCRPLSRSTTAMKPQRRPLCSSGRCWRLKKESATAVLNKQPTRPMRLRHQRMRLRQCRMQQQGSQLRQSVYQMMRLLAASAVQVRSSAVSAPPCMGACHMLQRQFMTLHYDTIQSLFW